MINGSELAVSPVQTEQQKQIARDILINRLNYLNFQNKHIIINFRHKHFDRTIALNASPLPCSGKELDCVWQDSDAIPSNLSSFELQNIIVPMGRDSLLVSATHVEYNDMGFRVNLPESCTRIGLRKLER